MKKVGAAFEQGKLIKFTLGEDTKITKDDAKTIQDEKVVLIGILKAATEKEVKEEKLDIKKEYSVVEKVGAASEEGTLFESTVHIEKKLVLLKQ